MIGKEMDTEDTKVFLSQPTNNDRTPQTMAKTSKLLINEKFSIICS